MNNKEFRALMWENYRKNGMISHILFLFIMLLACSILMLGLFLYDLVLIFVPFVILPCLFVCEIATISFRDQSLMTLRGFFRCFKTYFSEKFNSTFRFFLSLLIGFLVSIIFGVIYITIIISILYHINFMDYQIVFNELNELLQQDYPNIIEFINAHKDFANTIAVICYVPTLFVFYLTFIFISTRHSVSLFNRLDNDAEAPGWISKTQTAEVIKKNRLSFTLTQLSYAWPLYILFIIGFGIGAYAGYMWVGTYASALTVGLSLALYMAYGIYGPFLLAGNEALYTKYRDQYSMIDKRMEQMFESTIEELIKKKEEEDTKKDSNES